MSNESRNVSTALVPMGESPVAGKGPSAVPALSIDQIFSDKSVYNALPEEYRPQAHEVAQRVDVTKDGAELTAIHERGKESQVVLNSLGTMLIDDKWVHETDYVGELLREVRDAKKEIKLDLVRKDPNRFRRFMMSLPWIGSWFNPIFAFKEGWEKVDSKVDGWLERLNDAEVEMVGQEGMLRQSQTGNLTAFRALDIAVAGGELGLAREFAEFKEAVLANQDTEDVVTLQELSNWRSGLENAALTLTRYQNARARAQANFPILAGMLQRNKTVVSDIVSLRETIIPQLRLVVGASIQNLQTRRRMQDNRALTELLQEGEQQLLAALGRAEAEEHALKMQTAGEGERIALLFDGLTELAKKAAENREKELQAFAESKKTILAAIDEWKTETRDVLVQNVKTD